MLRWRPGASWSWGSPSFSSASLRAFLCSCSEEGPRPDSPEAASVWRDSQFWGWLWKLLRLLFKTMLGGSFRGFGAAREAGWAPGSLADARGWGCPTEPLSLALWDMASEEVSSVFRAWGA